MACGQSGRPPLRGILMVLGVCLVIHLTQAVPTGAHREIEGSDSEAPGTVVVGQAPDGVVVPGTTFPALRLFVDNDASLTLDADGQIAGRAIRWMAYPAPASAEQKTNRGRSKSLFH